MKVGANDQITEKTEAEVQLAPRAPFKLDLMLFLHPFACVGDFQAHAINDLLQRLGLFEAVEVDNSGHCLCAIAWTIPAPRYPHPADRGWSESSPESGAAAARTPCQRSGKAQSPNQNRQADRKVSFTVVRTTEQAPRP